MYAVRVNRFQVRRNGKTYNAGEVIYGLDEAEAHRLADASQGEIEIVTVLPEPETPNGKELEAPAEKEPEEEGHKEPKKPKTRGPTKKE